ncbi:MAG: prephenate dehydrogenase dimerization domain-containing protein, partial [Christensenellaceae bacterium]
ALTSQLAHIVSNAYIKSPTIEGYRGFTGGSFQDMTRIAGVDESIWSELYFANLPNIKEELDGLISALKCYSEAFAEEDEERMKELLREGRLIKERFKELS